MSKATLSGFKRTEISRELFRTINRAFCFVCKKPVQLFEFKEVTDHLKINSPDVLKLAEQKVLHRIHNSRGIVMICADSLYRHFENRQTKELNPKFLREAVHITN